MTSAKRVIIATLTGAVCGFICLWMASRGNEIPRALKFDIVSSRVLIGFVIGISAIRMNWVLHGLIMGFIVGIPMAFASMLGAAEAGYAPREMFFMSLVIGAVYGFLIELVTSVIFRAKQVRKS